MSVAGGVTYVVGAIGVEMIGGFYLEDKGIKEIASREVGATYQMLILPIKEGLEMFGILIFLKALFDYVGSEWKQVIVSFIGSANAK